MENEQRILLELEEAIRAQGGTVNDLCAQIGINRATWSRWKSGQSSPRLVAWRKVEALHEELRAA